MNERFSPQNQQLASLDGLVEHDYGENDRKFTHLSRYRYSVLEDISGNRYFSKQLAGNDLAADENGQNILNANRHGLNLQQTLVRHIPS